MRARARVFLFTQPRKNPRNRLGYGKQLLQRKECFEELGLVGNRSQPPSNVKLESPAFDPILGACDRDSSHVVHADQAASLLSAAGKGDLEFAAEILSVRMSQQETGAGFGIWGHVERFAVTDARQGAGRHIAHRVATGFPSRDSHRRQPSHQGGSVLNMDEVELEILPRGHVQDPV